ncbi:MAG: hypothetical protein LUD72_03240 [Bacteroidales bacterium]|nr:hypothetical protein [Bacteroidales bacterium]
MVLNYYEHSTIKKEEFPEDWQDGDTLNDLESFLTDSWQQRCALYNDDIESGKQMFLDFKNGGNVRTKNYVGTIAFKGHRLNIFPWAFKSGFSDDGPVRADTELLTYNLTKWLEYCTKSDYPYINLRSETIEENSIKGLLVSLYAKYVNTVIETEPFFRYEEVTEDRFSVKGKVDVADYYLKKFPKGNLGKLSCTYSSFEFDNLLNRIIKHVCRMLLSENDLSAATVETLGYILSRLSDVTDCAVTPYDCDRVVLNRTQDSYTVILGMSKMFLFNEVTSFDTGGMETYCFLFPTELLYEGFVGSYIKEALRGRAKVTLQKPAYVFSQVIYGDKSFGPFLQMKHDIFVEDGLCGTKTIFDTKYKKLDRLEGQNEEGIRKTLSDVKSSDVYQMITYARSEDIGDIYLLYPMFYGEKMDITSVYGVSSTVSRKEPDINVHILRIPFVLGKNSDNLSILNDIVSEIFPVCKCHSGLEYMVSV